MYLESEKNVSPAGEVEDVPGAAVSVVSAVEFVKEAMFTAVAVDDRSSSSSEDEHGTRDPSTKETTPEPEELDVSEEFSALKMPSPPTSWATGPFTQKALRLMENTHVDFKNINNTKLILTGNDLDVSELISYMRYKFEVSLDPSAKPQVDDSVDFLQDAINGPTPISLYGVTTGYGASADTRTTDTDKLQESLLQMQLCGVPESASMPEDWVRCAMVIRANSLMRGHSGVRWEFLERLLLFINRNIIPVVPLRGSVSASGDLSPLSYIAGALIGYPGVWVTMTDKHGGREKVRAQTLTFGKALSYQAKEVLSMINGTAVSCSVAAVAIHEAQSLAYLSQVLTAMGIEATGGTSESFDEFIAEVRPHSGQKDAAATIYGLLQGSQLAVDPKTEQIGETALRQDRYPFRTASQWIGPQLEDLQLAFKQVAIELNSTTDNPLIDVPNERFVHGGNFQAMSLTSAMEKTRLCLQNIGTLLYTQCTEVINNTPSLPPNLTATNPSLSFTAKGIDISMAAYNAELGFLANPVCSHVQTAAENRNQAVHSLALISARQTVEACRVLRLMAANLIYTLCQALDLRILVDYILHGFKEALESACERFFKGYFEEKEEYEKLVRTLKKELVEKFNATTSLDEEPRMLRISSELTTPVILALAEVAPGASLLSCGIVRWRKELETEFLRVHRASREYEYFEEVKSKMGAAKTLYSFVREDVGVLLNEGRGMGVGEGVWRIYQAMEDGAVEKVLVDMGKMKK